MVSVTLVMLCFSGGLISRTVSPGLISATPIKAGEDASSMLGAASPLGN